MCIYKVEDEDEIQNVLATVAGGSEVKKEGKNEDKVQETSSAKINTSELPPHVVLDMPALSPTMVRIKPLVIMLNFLSFCKRLRLICSSFMCRTRETFISGERMKEIRLVMLMV